MDIQAQVNEILARLNDVEKGVVGINTDPETYRILSTIITTVATTVATSVATSTVTTAISALPTQIISGSAPSGTAVTGSIWFEDTGVLATRKIWVYNSGWIQFK